MLKYRNLAACLLIAHAASSSFVFAKQIKPDKLRVRFVARSTAIRTTWGGNEDVYLVEAQNASDGKMIYAKVVDSYPSYTPPLPMRVLVSNSSVTLSLTRDPQCDVLWGNMSLRSAPGDLMAIVPAKLTYQPAEVSSIPPDSSIPCYRIAGKRPF